MRPEHKKYILENIGKRSIKEIADSLGIRERSVRKYLEAKGMKGPRAEKPLSHPEGKRPLPIPAFGRWARVLSVIAIIVLIFAAYSTSLGNDFIWDDEFLIRDNTAIKSFGNAVSIFKTYLAATSGNVNTFYRPIQELSYMVDYHFWRNDPFGYHLTNIILHAVCAVILYFLSLRILKDGFAAFVTALLFGIHPVNTEAVTYIAGRADSLYLLFFLASFVLFLRSQEGLHESGRFNAALYVLALLAYGLALLSKEMAMILPLFLVLYILVFVPVSAARKRFYAWCLPFGGLALLYVIARKTILDFSSGVPSFTMAKYSLGIRLLTTCKAITTYLSLVAAPFNLHMERMIATMPSFSEAATLGALFLVTALFVISWQFYRHSKRLFFAAIWFFLGLLPVSNIVPINSFIAEHWLYLPAIGVFMIAGALCGNIFHKTNASSPYLWKAVALSLVLAASVFFGVLTFERNKDWKDGVTFFKNTLKYSPKNARLHLNFGNTYTHLKQFDNAMAEHKKAVELNPNYAEAYSNIAAIYLYKKDYRQARKNIEKALALKPDFPVARSILRAIEKGEKAAP